MQNLGRLHQQQATEISHPSTQAFREVELMNINRYTALPTDDFSQRRSKARHCFCCCQTQGLGFNLLVGIVVIVNSLLIGIEADLGLLGPGGPQWAGIEADMQKVGMAGTGPHYKVEKKLLQSELDNGLKADHAVKEDVEEQLNGTLHEDVDVNERLTLPAGSYKLRSAAYTMCEYFFVIFYLLEMLLRFCDLGCRAYCWEYPWVFLDVTVVTTGLLDVLLPFFFTMHAERTTTLPLLRMTRVLRLLKLFQVFEPLRLIGRAIAKAFTVVLQVGLVVLVLDFAIAVILTSLVGQLSHQWGKSRFEVETWFGSIGRSMQTLFLVQTLDGWQHIVEVLGEVIPQTVLVPAIVLYMMLCCFTLIGLVTSVISDSFMAAQFREQRLREVDKDLRRIDTKRLLTQLLANCAKSNHGGVLTRADLESVLNSSPIEAMLHSIDVITTKQDILKLYDQLQQDPAWAGKINAECMAEAATSLVGKAEASSVFDLKNRMIGMALKAEAADQAAATQKQETMMNASKYEAQILEVKQDVVNVSHEMAKLKDQVSSIMTRWDVQSKRQEQENQQHRDAVASVKQTVGLLCTQMNVALSNLGGKVDGITSQLVAHSAINDKVDAQTAKVDAQTALLGQVAEQLQALKSEPTKRSEDFEIEARSEAQVSESRPSEPAAEPPSTNHFAEFDILTASNTTPVHSDLVGALPEAACTDLEVKPDDLTVGSSESQTEPAGVPVAGAPHEGVTLAGAAHERWATFAHEPLEQWASLPDLGATNQESKPSSAGTE